MSNEDNLKWTFSKQFTQQFEATFAGLCSGAFAF
jgi:hypothetical protein